MLIYVVTEVFWNREEVRGVYSTRELAQEAMQAMGWGTYFLYTRELDAPGVEDDIDDSTTIRLTEKAA